MATLSERTSYEGLMTDGERNERATRTFWQTIGLLYRKRWLIISITGVAAILSVVFTLMMPNWYRAHTRLLLPESGGSISSALSNISSVAASFLGGEGGDYIRYIAILSSRTVLANVVEAFDLVEVYELEESETPVADAVDALSGNVEFVIDSEYEFLSVQVLDKDPERAAAMANFFVGELNRLNAQLASQSAATFRSYVENRYAEAETALDSVLNGMQTFQRTYGVYDLPEQTARFFEQIASLRAQALEAEIQYEALRERLGPDNEQVKAYEQIARAADRKYRQALDGEEILLPVPQSEVPDVMRAYIDLERERLIQTTLLETIAPLREQARFEEQRKVEAVQVVDAAVPPAKKAAPKRSILCIVATMSAFVLAVLFVILRAWWRRNHGWIAERLRTSVAAAE